jgi:hypothetical protein
MTKTISKHHLSNIYFNIKYHIKKWEFSLSNKMSTKPKQISKLDYCRFVAYNGSNDLEDIHFSFEDEQGEWCDPSDWGILTNLWRYLEKNTCQLTNLF